MALRWNTHTQMEDIELDEMKDISLGLEDDEDSVL